MILEASLSMHYKYTVDFRLFALHVNMPQRFYLDLIASKNSADYLTIPFSVRNRATRM